MTAKKRGKRTGLRARSKNARQSKSVQKRLKAQKEPDYVVEMVHLPKGTADYVMEVAEIAEVPPSLVIAVFAANSIYHGRRVPDQQRTAMIAELFDARGKLASCRQIMEANDPLNAVSIFGPPVPSPAPAETQSGEASSDEPAQVAQVEYPPEGVCP